jgi:hypothetical protein
MYGNVRVARGTEERYLTVTMPDPMAVVAHVERAFADVAYPGAAFLQGSFDGCEPAEAIAPFTERTRWQGIDSAVLDDHAEALSFLSEGGFRFFLPAYLVADLREELTRADPVFHLTHGFRDLTVQVPTSAGVHTKNFGASAFINPRRYGAMTFEDHARHRLAVFARAEAGAIVAYLEHRRDTDAEGLVAAEIDPALDRFWRARAANAPQAEALAAHLEAEAAYLRDLTR